MQHKYDTSGNDVTHVTPAHLVPVAVEEDGDEIFTPMPKFCGKWPCCRDKARVRPTMQSNGVRAYCCEQCHASYGLAPKGKNDATR